MNQAGKTVFFRKDYKAPEYSIEEISLNFELYNDKTRVTAKSSIRRKKKGNPCPLILNGEDLQLISVKINGQALSSSEYNLDDTSLTVLTPPAVFELETVTEIYPQENKALEGLYQSGPIFCSQCEAEGFRKITYYLDRPDILAVFTTRIEADIEKCPVMLSNGNLIDKGSVEGNRHFVVWKDPFPKPCYLFALVAGRLSFVRDKFITRSGRTVDLEIYVEEKNLHKCGHAMASLKKAMEWDEKTYGLEYDLDTYMIVAVDDFNMGAMENKGLNIFNSKYVLSSPETATDEDYIGVEGVIAHEYFHNWTGNRVTCRDWFQLSLKEGLTVFRDQTFSAEMNSPTVQRIKDVQILRNFQFREDSGPMAHPVRPETYEEINNFYTVTVYNKGAEVVRMVETLLGREGFRKGMNLYFKRHDGQAVTCDDFIAAMADATGTDLEQFKNWYCQAGTPVIEVTSHWEADSGEFHLTVSQNCPDTPGQKGKDKKPFHIPLALGLLAEDGRDLLGKNGRGTDILHFKKKKQTFSFSGIAAKPVVSFLRDFSAPVDVKTFQQDEELAFLMKFDSNLYNRWESATRLATSTILDIVKKLQKGSSIQFNELFFEAVFHSITEKTEKTADPALLALALELPPETALALQLENVDPDLLFQARTMIKRELAARFQNEFLQLYKDNKEDDQYSISPGSMGKRRLKNCALSYLMSLDPMEESSLQLCVDQFTTSENMTDTIAALRSISHHPGTIRDSLFSDFYRKWEHDSLVMDKWFSMQAISSHEECLSTVKHLLNNKLFSMENPNKVRALIGAFSSGNHVRFHALDGEGYSFLADMIIQLDNINPQIAARLVSPLTTWRRYEKRRQALMRKELERIAKKPDLSPDVSEIVNKSR
ncbi:aminopeptidase N [Desulfomarina sp.]